VAKSPKRHGLRLHRVVSVGSNKAEIIVTGDNIYTHTRHLKLREGRWICARGLDWTEDMR
jgi:hypothetical protein